MAFPNIFTESVTKQLLERIDNLTIHSTALWGTMQVAQMLAHCNVTYELIYTDKHPKPNFLVRFLLKMMVKKNVTNEVPYPHNQHTAKVFKISDAKMFDAEKTRLKDYMIQTLKLGEAHFNGKESHSFGALSAIEWNNMLYKHLDHHLKQFGV